MDKIDISIEQLMFMRDQRYIWLSNPKNYSNRYYAQVRAEYENFNNTIIAYNNGKKERRVRIIASVAAAAVTGAIGLVGLGITTKISTSPIGAEFERSTRGMSGKLLGNLFR